MMNEKKMKGAKPNPMEIMKAISPEGAGTYIEHRGMLQGKIPNPRELTQIIGTASSHKDS